MQKTIHIYKCSYDMHETVVTVELPLNTVKDRYNLRLDGCPLMLTRQGGDYLFQVIWPEKVEFAIGTGESVLVVSLIMSLLCMNDVIEDKEK
mgnify:CR=1 FL=1